MILRRATYYAMIMVLLSNGLVAIGQVVVDGDNSGESSYTEFQDKIEKIIKKSRRTKEQAFLNDYDINFGFDGGATINLLQHKISPNPPPPNFGMRNTFGNGGFLNFFAGFRYKRHLFNVNFTLTDQHYFYKSGSVYSNEGANLGILDNSLGQYLVDNLPDFIGTDSKFRIFDVGISYRYILLSRQRTKISVGAFIHSMLSPISYTGIRQQNRTYNFSTSAGTIMRTSTVDNFHSHQTISTGLVIGGELKFAPKFWVGLFFKLRYIPSTVKAAYTYTTTITDGISPTPTYNTTRRVDLELNMLLFQPNLKFSYVIDYDKKRKKALTFKQLERAKTKPIDTSIKTKNTIYFGTSLSPSLSLSQRLNYTPSTISDILTPYMPHQRGKGTLQNTLGILPYLSVFIGLQNAKKIWEFSLNMEAGNPMLQPLAIQNTKDNYAYYGSQYFATTHSIILQAVRYYSLLSNYKKWSLWLGPAIGLHIIASDPGNLSTRLKGQEKDLIIDAFSSQTFSLMIGASLKLNYKLNAKTSIFCQMQADIVPYLSKHQLIYAYIPTDQQEAQMQDFQTVSITNFLGRFRPMLGIQWAIK